MKRTAKAHLVSLLFAFVFYLQCTAQEKKDSAFYVGVTKNLEENTLTPKANLLNGFEYISIAYDSRKGHPYFGASTFQTGSLLYEGIIYKNVPLLYDLFQDELIAGDTRKVGLVINLIKTKVTEFYLGDHRFIYLEPLNKNIKGFAGFYDCLYDDSVQVLVKRSKKGLTSGRGEISSFKDMNSYYIKIGNVFTEVNDKKSLLNAFDDKKMEMLHFMKREKVKFSENPEGALVKMADYYRSL
ncbi:hypothetical protein EFA69_17920 [Rufibacter immobilis]|uniref:GLPGLI family protein n=1 Tax=Rufibacter immobilis TaxID=1348778 RepID=A0A3M9MQZ7_9BACT|nr:hypothetical protein [Rufibacter immobilis]RNI27964.1 hypothetical protein EFA69_17920 [Rufibacter immobilis]